MSEVEKKSPKITPDQLELVKEYATQLREKSANGEFEQDMDQDDYEEWKREEDIYNKLDIDEKGRWNEVRKIFVSIENDLRYQYIDGVKNEVDALNSYFTSAELTDPEKEAYLRKARLKCIRKISKYHYGRELLDRYTIEKYLYLFCKIKEYKPKDILEVNIFNEKDEDEIKIKLIRSLAKLRAITVKLSSIDLSIPECPHLKDVTKTPKHYEAIIKVLVEEGIIHKETNSWLLTKEYSKKFAGSFINSLAFAGYLRITPNYMQIKYITESTFNLKLGDVNAKSKEFNDPGVKHLRNSIEKLVANNSLNFLNSFSSILPDF